ncbi:hypothetical protein THIOKS110003 [Thiocapsa sp. KS1]|nr:hypothetical protein THIOKS110003 [Thiocapsa sp. KS1]
MPIFKWLFDSVSDTGKQWVWGCFPWHGSRKALMF